MIRMILAALAVIATADLVLAQTSPVSRPADPRVRQFTYNADTVYELDTHTHYITTINFERGEQVESIVIGDSTSWEVVRLQRGDVITVKALIEGAYSNMTVYTDRRTYTFDLNAQRGWPNENSVNYRVQFAYPTSVVEFPGSIQTRPLADRRADYRIAGTAPFAPLEIYDDGTQTVFTIPSSARMPAVFRTDASGRESLVNTRVAGDRIIVDGVSDRWTLRVGTTAICVAHTSVFDTVPDRRMAAVSPSRRRDNND